MYTTTNGTIGFGMRGEGESSVSYDDIQPPGLHSPRAQDRDTDRDGAPHPLPPPPTSKRQVADGHTVLLPQEREKDGDGVGCARFA